MGFQRAKVIRERFGAQAGKRFLLCGMDEVGRGAFAGPLVAAGVVLPAGFRHKWLRDSKLLSGGQREAVDQVIREHALGLAVVAIEVEEINAKGLGWANREVFALLVDLVNAEGYCCDGNLKIVASKPVHSIIKGDGLVPEIAAASIVAKVFRDNLMGELGKEVPWFGWGSNRGYGTGVHLTALGEHGAHAQHRDVFVRNWIAKQGVVQ
jgi:ribonuclease HII